MNLATLIPLVLQASIALTVFCVGLEASHRDALYLLRRPAELLRAIVSMNVVMPLVAFALVKFFDFHIAVDAALLTLSVSPVPPVFPKKSIKAGGGVSYTIGLLVAVSLLSIVTIPLTVELVSRALSLGAHMSPIATAKVVAITILVPLGAGMLVRAIVPSMADPIAKPLAKIATIVLVLAVIPLLVVAWPAMSSLIGGGTLIALAVFVVIGLAVGHLLGGPDPNDRTVLALSTAVRHPGMAMAIVNANNPGNKLLFGALLLYILTHVILTIPYLRWTRSKQDQVAGTVGI
jgi:bile acid:Na+ symporter, BASS family